MQYQRYWKMQFCIQLDIYIWEIILYLQANPHRLKTKNIKSLIFISFIIKYHISSNKCRTSNKHCPLISAASMGIYSEISASTLIKHRSFKCRTYQNSYYILVVAKAKCIYDQYANNKTAKILLTFRFFHHIWYIDGENLCFIFNLEKNGKVLIFNFVHFPNFEISVYL